MMGPGHGWSFGGPWAIMLAVGLILLVVGLVWAMRSSRPQDRPKNAARDVLRERFARGEISEEEFRARLRVLDDV